MPCLNDVARNRSKFYMSIMINECVQQRQQPPQQPNPHHHRHQEHALTLTGQNGVHSAANQLNHHPILSGPVQTSMIIDYQSASQGQHYSHHQTTVPQISSPVAPIPASLANNTPQHSFVVNQTVMVPSVVVNYHNHSHLHQTSIATNNDYHSSAHQQHQNQHPFHQPHQHYPQPPQQSHNEHHLQPQTNPHEQHPLNGYSYTMYHHQQTNVQTNETNYLYHSNVNYDIGKQVNSAEQAAPAGYNDGGSLMTNGYHHQHQQHHDHHQPSGHHHQQHHHHHSHVHHQRHHAHAPSHQQHTNMHHQQQSLNLHSQSHHHQHSIQHHQHHQPIHHQSTHPPLPVNSHSHLSTGAHGQQQSPIHPLQHHQQQHSNQHHHQGNEISDYHDVSKIFNVINANDSQRVCVCEFRVHSVGVFLN